MADYSESSQLNLWLFRDPEELAVCRSKANFAARAYLSASAEKQSAESTAPDATTSKVVVNLPVECVACGFSKRVSSGQEPKENHSDYDVKEPHQNTDGNLFLTTDEESLLVNFYISKLPSLIGPAALVSRLRRESKVTATAATLCRRFFLSNSVQLYDPKVIMVAAAFLASKVEDCTADVRYLEEGTGMLQAPVTIAEIISAEISLLSGVHFDLLCFHPYKAVLALTEDLRMYLKSEKGRILLVAPDGGESSRDKNLTISGQDLKPIYDRARVLLDDAVLSDLPLLYTPGQIGFASLCVAQEEVLQNIKGPSPPRIDLIGYLKLRFPAEGADVTWLPDTIYELCQRLGELKNGTHGCGKYGTDMKALKAIHKKLKKVRAWGNESKKKKRGTEKSEEESEAKKQKS